MLNVQTICILGAPGQQISRLILALSKQNRHRILLAGENRSFLEQYLEELVPEQNRQNIEVLECLVNGCWEADIIVMDLLPETIRLHREKLAMVVNQKTIIHVNEPSASAILQQGFHSIPPYAWREWFPHSPIVRVFIGSFASLVESDQQEGAAQVMQLFQEAGLNPFESEKTIEQTSIPSLHNQ